MRTSCSSGVGGRKAAFFFVFMTGEHKKLRPACPAKSFNPFPLNDLNLSKNAPYILALPRKLHTHLPLLPPREERAGERRAVFPGIPLSPTLPTPPSWGEGDGPLVVVSRWARWQINLSIRLDFRNLC